MKCLFSLMLATFLTFPVFAMNTPQTEPTVLIMLGAPGAGKGTQAVRLSETLQVPQISTGDLFRENLRNQTPIGEKAKKYMEKGQLVPDELVLDMLFERLKAPDCQKGYILDGFPRTISQAEALNRRLQRSHMIAITLEVPDEIILERLTGRTVCETCGAPYHKVTNPPQKEGICDRCGGKLIQRSDDTEAVVLERLKVFHQQTEPLKNYYEKKGALLSIDGAVSKEETLTQLNTKLKSLGLHS